MSVWMKTSVFLVFASQRIIIIIIIIHFVWFQFSFLLWVHARTTVIYAAESYISPAPAPPTVQRPPPLAVSPRRCSSVCSIGWGGVLNIWWWAGCCCKELLDPHQARDMFLLQTTLPVTMTTNRHFLSSTSPKCFSTQIQPSPLLPQHPTP